MPTKCTAISLHSPFDKGQILPLKAGDAVTINGTIFTGRDRLHAALCQGTPSPVPLLHAAIYHCGPIMVPQADTWHVVAAGPTTSSREDPYMPTIIARHGLSLIIGKGGMGPETMVACREYGCVYLQATGGAAASLARRITAVRQVFFLDDFGTTEAMWQFEVKNLEAFVGIDAHGNSLYRQVRHSSHLKLKTLLNS